MSILFLLPETWYNFDCVIYCIVEGTANFKIKINRVGDLSQEGKVRKYSAVLKLTFNKIKNANFFRF